MNEESEIPPFISLHIRHGDFGRLCPNATDPFDGCYAPLSTFASVVNEINSALRAKGIVADRVLLTSDEERQDWWNEVRALGWTWIDHEALKTAELFGDWYVVFASPVVDFVTFPFICRYPVFIDAVAQSLGAGFVGTETSTMSLMAGRRVVDWNGGPVRYVRWDDGRVQAR